MHLSRRYARKLITFLFSVTCVNNNNNNNTLIYIAPACRMTSEALAEVVSPSHLMFLDLQFQVNWTDEMTDGMQHITI